MATAMPANFAAAIKNIKSLNIEEMEDPEPPMRKSHRCFECLKYEMEPGRGQPNADEVKELKTCGCCKTARFCSKVCQKLAWSKHKESCKKIQKLTAELFVFSFCAIQQETSSKNGFRSNTFTEKDVEFHRGCSDPNLKGVCKSYKMLASRMDIDAESQYGRFDQYIWSKQAIAYAIWNIAETCQSYPLYEQHYKMVCELISQTMFGFCEMKAAMIMSLVAMQRYDEAYRMIQFMFMIFTKLDSKIVAVMMSKLPPEGWSEILKSGLAECHSIMGYNRNGNDSLFHQVEDACRQCVNFPWYDYVLISLAIIKFRRIKRMGMVPIHHPMAHIFFMTLGVSQDEIEKFQAAYHEQHVQLGKLTDLIFITDFYKKMDNFLNNRRLADIETYYDYEEHLTQTKICKSDAVARRVWKQVSRHPELIDFMRGDIEKNEIDESYLNNVRENMKMKDNLDKTAKKFLDNNLPVEGYVEEWEDTWGYMRAEGEGSALGKIFVHKKNIKGLPRHFLINVGQKLIGRLAIDEDVGRIRDRLERGEDRWFYMAVDVQLVPGNGYEAESERSSTNEGNRRKSNPKRNGRGRGRGKGKK